MTEHTPSSPVRVDAHCWQVTCSCGNVEEGPTPEGARNRWEVHEHIADARAALEEGRKGNDGGQ